MHPFDRLWTPGTDDGARKALLPFVHGTRGDGISARGRSSRSVPTLPGHTSHQFVLAYDSRKLSPPTDISLLHELGVFQPLHWTLGTALPALFRGRIPLAQIKNPLLGPSRIGEGLTAIDTFCLFSS